MITLLNSDESLPKKMILATQSADNQPIKYTAEEALALYIDGGYTKKAYKDLQSGTKKRNANIFPTYDVLLSAKKMCYPSGLNVTDHSFEVPLQSLVDHTVSRLYTAHAKDFPAAENNNIPTITAIYKWGCDGSSGHATYRQNFNDTNACMIDQHMFSVCLVPLQIVLGSTIIWKNMKPSSTRYCRPVKLLCLKETSDLVRDEVNNFKSQIAEIQPTRLEKYEVHHKFHMTMIDGKVFSVLAESSSLVCGICGTTPKKMNDIIHIQNLPCKENLYEYGLSSLHAWIRFLDCILHISYRIILKKWQVRSSEKAAVDVRKMKIQDNLRKEMGILIDVPKPGSGNTNNGNTARRFFQEPKKAAKITGVSSVLIYRFSVILRTLACGYEIDTEAFQHYALQTAIIFVDLYPWFYMPTSVHKILMHGAEIIKHFALPIGMMSEEALEARNKDLRKYRLHHTRKNSRKNTMEDLANTLFISSDPFITMLSKGSVCSSKVNEIVDNDVISLILNKDVEEDLSNDSSSDTE